MLGILQNICRGGNKNILILGIILMIFGSEGGAQGQISSDSVSEARFSLDTLIQQAQSLALADDRAWLNLLHYKISLLGEPAGQADDPAFFLSVEGGTSPDKELIANLRAFFVTNKQNPVFRHAQCRFPARLHWLDSRLNFRHALPAVNCNEFINWKKKLNAHQVTLLFPSMYLENPASMFGHTFIRFDQPGQNPLLSKTLSYAAVVNPDDVAIAYAWKGITGGYNGQFNLKAYFETLQEYSDIEQRDIWEYALNLNDQEVDQLVRHLWEIKGIKFDYYFLRENCAFRLLALLDVARENINMSLHSHSLYALPVDIVRDIQKAGLIQQRYYRPAIHNKIQQMAEQLPESQTRQALSLASGDKAIDMLSTDTDLAELDKARIYLLADELLNQKKDRSKNDRDRQLGILSARSKLEVNQEEVNYSFHSGAPELSHGSARIQLSAGKREQRSDFYELGFRPVFHDLLDPHEGFVNGAAISIFDIKFRWYKDQETLKLENLNLFSIRSLVPVKPWYTTLSRQLTVQLEKRNLTETQQVDNLRMQFGIGYATETNDLLMYMMPMSELDYATALDENHGFYLGLEAGTVWAYNSGLFSGQAELNIQVLQQVSGEPGDIVRASAGVQVDVIKEHAFRLEYEYTEYDTFEIDQAKISYLVYF